MTQSEQVPVDTLARAGILHINAMLRDGLLEQISSIRITLARIEHGFGEFDGRVGADSHSLCSSELVTTDLSGLISSTRFAMLPGEHLRVNTGPDATADTS